MKAKLFILYSACILSACAVSHPNQPSTVKPMQEQTNNHYIGSSFIGTVKAINGGEVILEGKRGSVIRVLTNPLETPFSVGEKAVFVTPDNPYIQTGKSELIKWHIWKENRDRIFNDVKDYDRKITEFNKNIKENKHSVFQ